jgi:hypothetical protein
MAPIISSIEGDPGIQYDYNKFVGLERPDIEEFLNQFPHIINSNLRKCETKTEFLKGLYEQFEAVKGCFEDVDQSGDVSAIGFIKKGDDKGMIPFALFKTWKELCVLDPNRINIHPTWNCIDESRRPENVLENMFNYDLWPTTLVASPEVLERSSRGYGYYLNPNSHYSPNHFAVYQFVNGKYRRNNNKDRVIQAFQSMSEILPPQIVMTNDGKEVTFWPVDRDAYLNLVAHTRYVDQEEKENQNKLRHIRFQLHKLIKKSGNPNSLKLEADLTEKKINEIFSEHIHFEVFAFDVVETKPDLPAYTPIIILKVTSPCSAHPIDLSLNGATSLDTGEKFGVGDTWKGWKDYVPPVYLNGEKEYNYHDFLPIDPTDEDQLVQFMINCERKHPGLYPTVYNRIRGSSIDGLHSITKSYEVYYTFRLPSQQKSWLGSHLRKKSSTE